MRARIIQARIVGVLAAAALCGCGEQSSALTGSETSNATEVAEESLSSTRDVLSGAGAADTSGGAPGALLLSVSCAAPQCNSGSAGCSATVADANTYNYSYTFSACVLATNPQLSRDGNRTLVISRTGATWATRTVTETHAFVDTQLKGARAGDKILSTVPTPIVTASTGTKATGQLVHTIQDGLEHRERQDSAGKTLHSVDITYANLVATETYPASATKVTRPSTTTLSGGQSVHHLLWKVHAANTYSSLTFEWNTCSCAPTSGQVEHKLEWDDGARTIDFTRTWSGCGNATMSGTDSLDNRTVQITTSDSCS